MSNFDNNKPMPVLFLGHGSPMNAIEENEFVKGFRKVSEEIVQPKAILCISAHWETKGSYITAMEKPKTIHDFGGFPKELYNVQYPANGDPDLAIETKKTVKYTELGLDQDWGLDHGSWSVIKHMYPNANVPVLQLSIDNTKPARYHYELAKELNFLRKKGVLIVGSGNMVHNLSRVTWNNPNAEFGHDWAIEADQKMKSLILDGDHEKLINYHSNGSAFKLAIPTPEHYIPLLYSIALKGKSESIELFNDKLVGGAITMTSLKIS
ncbi:MAG: 4,5-DOPA dioxygenase extradiol [Bacteroidia bacterium]|nr:4,5-DOPA dioxygenase extradiol [Bacteroidia bacterium]